MHIIGVGGELDLARTFDMSPRYLNWDPRIGFDDDLFLGQPWPDGGILVEIIRARNHWEFSAEKLDLRSCQRFWFNGCSFAHIIPVARLELTRLYSKEYNS